MECITENNTYIIKAKKNIKKLSINKNIKKFIIKDNENKDNNLSLNVDKYLYE
ncbi:hypothetical protein HOG21_00240 [bacterium]|jgi:hypothetical protein|nr:hypothetical protein [bacterium]